MCNTCPDANVTNDMDAVLNDKDIKGVVIAVPAALHYYIAPKALLSNKHVLVEKPLSLAYGDGEKLVQLEIYSDLLPPTISPSFSALQENSLPI
jgi:predicted dehydrogenase